MKSKNREIEEMYSLIMENENDPRRSHILEVLEKNFGTEAVLEWIKVEDVEQS